MNDEPEDLLTARLIRQETEISQLKAANDMYSNALKFCDTFICQIIESLPEPLILRDIAEQIKDQLYIDYLNEQARIIDLYKTTLEKTQRELQ
jgi:hypothetical protein